MNVPFPAAYCCLTTISTFHYMFEPRHCIKLHKNSNEVDNIDTSSDRN